MPNMDVAIEIFHAGDAAGEVVLSIDFSWSSGAPAHMGSMTYPGHPADPPEMEIETIFWPVKRWDNEASKFIDDHVEMPSSGIPAAVSEAIEAHIVENYDDSHDHEF